MIREETLNYKLFYDLKMAAANEHKNIKIYKPEIDNQGCDVVFEDDLDLSRKMQIKTKVISKTKKWDIHRTILLPGMHQAEDYGFHLLCPTTPGGFILIDVTENLKPNNEELQTTYFYRDINVISLIALGHLPTPKKSKAEALNLIELLKDNKNKKVVIKQCMLIKVSNAFSLIKMSGLLQEYDFSYNAWKLNQLTFNYQNYFKVNPYEKDPEYWAKINVDKNNAIRGHYENVKQVLDSI